MKFHKQPVLNRYGLKMLVHFEPSKIKTNKLVIIQHGYSGSMDEDHIHAFGKTFLDNGYNVLMMDSTNSFNDAEGVLEDNTIQSHYDDLEDTINWAKTQEWYNEPFALAGHSLGGLSILIYAQKHPSKISLLFPAASVISGELLETSKKENEPKNYADLIQTGKMFIECGYKEGVTGYRPYSWYETMQDWNALNQAEQLTMPVLFVVGSEDYSTPPKHQKLLFNKLPNSKEIHVIDGVDHCYDDKVDEVCTHLNNFLKRHA